MCRLRGAALLTADARKLRSVRRSIWTAWRDQPEDRPMAVETTQTDAVLGAENPWR